MVFVCVRTGSSRGRSVNLQEVKTTGKKLLREVNPFDSSSTTGTALMQQEVVSSTAFFFTITAPRPQRSILNEESLRFNGTSKVVVAMELLSWRDGAAQDETMDLSNATGTALLGFCSEYHRSVETKCQ